MVITGLFRPTNRMKKKVKHLEECRKAFEIEIPPAEVKSRLEECYNKIGKAAVVPGYRAGKAPRDLLEKHYGERATQEVIENLIADSYQQAVEESDFLPLGLPDITDVKLDDAKMLSFKAEFNIRPKIELKNYKGLRLNRKKVEVKEEDIDKSIKALQESNAKYKEVQDRPAKVGDYIVCDSEIFIEGKSIMKKRENIWMPVEEKSYIPNLSNALTGANRGDEKEIETVLPQDFPKKDSANKKAVFKIKIKEIKERILSQVDDGFAKDLGYNALTQLRDSVKAILENQIERQARQNLENQVLEKLLADAGFNIPSALVEKQLNYLVDEEKEKLLKQGLKEGDLKNKEQELREKLRPLAEKQVKTMFILDEIANTEKIDVSREELEGALEAIAKQYGQSKEKIEKYYKENDLISGLRLDIKHSKILELLIKEAKVEEGPSSPTPRP